MRSELKEDLNLEDGVLYPATIRDIENFELETQQFGPSYKWYWKVNDGEKTGEKTAITTQNYKASTKLGAFVYGLMGTLPKVFDTHDFIGKDCQVEVARQRNKDGTVKKNNMGVPCFTVVGMAPPQQRQLSSDASSDAEDYQAVRQHVE